MTDTDETSSNGTMHSTNRAQLVQGDALRLLFVGLAALGMVATGGYIAGMFVSGDPDVLLVAAATLLMLGLVMTGMSYVTSRWGGAA